MFGFGKKAKAKANEMKEMSIKAENKDLMEAIVGAVALVAYADGELEAEEVNSIKKLLGSTKQLEPFGAETMKYFDTLCDRFENGFRVAKLEVMRELSDIKATPQDAEITLVTAVEIAYADGELEPEEEKVLEQIADKVGLRLSDYMD